MDFEPSVPVAAGDGPAKQTNSPVASIDAARPLALIFMWQAPRFCQSLIAKRDPGACPQRGKNWESSRYTRRKLGNCALRGALGLPSIGEIVLESMAPVPAEGIGVMSLLARMAGRQMRHVSGLDHDFVIDTSRRNKLKDRPN
jgi:hypothetical protein